MKLYTDPTTQKELSPNSAMHIGSFVYSSIEWTIKTLESKVNFYIDSCEINIGAESNLPLISDNCYAQVFRAHQVQQSKVVSDRSVFGFQTFIAGRSQKHMRMNLSCCIKVCIKEECFRQMTIQDAQCPQKPDGFRFTAYQVGKPSNRFG